MAENEVKEIDPREVIDYASRRACEVVKDMPRDFRRLMAFSEAWVEAAKEYINAHKS